MGRIAKNKNLIENKQRKISWAISLFPHFQEKGLKAFNMDQVAKTLGVSKATVYKYFKNREEILEIILTHKLSQLSGIEEILGNKDTKIKEKYFKAVELMEISLGDISNIFLFDIKKYHPGLWEEIIIFKEFSLKILEAFYEEGIKKKILYPHKSKVLVLSDRIFIDSLLNPEFLIDESLTLQNAFSEYFNLKWYGMRLD